MQKFSLLILIVSLNLHAQTKKRECLACDFPFSLTSYFPNAGNACDDLYAAACLNADGTLKNHDKVNETFQKQKADIKAMIEKGREKALSEIGAESFGQGVLLRLKQSGVKVDPSHHEKIAYDDLYGELEDNDLKKIYKPYADCVNDQQAIKANMPGRIGPTAEKKSKLTALQTFDRETKEELATLILDNIQPSMQNFLNKMCPKAKENPKSVSSDVLERCNNFSKYRDEAIDLFRMEKTPDYEKKARKFITKFFVYEDRDYSDRSTLDLKLDAMISDTNDRCSLLKNIFFQRIKSSANQLASDIAISKATIDVFTTELFSEKQTQLARKIFASTIADVKDITGQIVSDPKKRKQIQSEFDQVGLFALQRPPDSSYTKTRGMLVLKDELNPMTIALREIFSDEKLGYFTDLNAFYTPGTKAGKIELVSEKVQLNAIMWRNMTSNPYEFLAVMAHEIGHKISKRQADVHQYNLDGDFKDLLACYEKPKSINMQPDQSTEVIADYVSAEVLAQQISKIPKENRMQAVLSSMETYCKFVDEAKEKHYVNCKEPHPQPRLRIAGIFGANPNLRKVMGCENESTKYDTCGLKSVQLSPSVGGTIMHRPGDPSLKTPFEKTQKGINK